MSDYKDNYKSIDQNYSQQYNDYEALAQKLYNNTRSSIKAFAESKRINSILKQIMLLYNEAENSSDKLLGNIYEELKAFNTGMKIDTSKNYNSQVEERKKQLNDIVNFYSDLNKLLEQKYKDNIDPDPNLKYSYLSPTANTTLNKLEQYIQGETVMSKSKNGKPSVAKTIVSGLQGDMSNLIKEISEPVAMMILQNSFNKNHSSGLKSIKMTSDSKNTNGFKQEARDMVVTMNPDGKGIVDIGVSIKQYKVLSAKTNPYVNLKLRDSSFGGSVLKFLTKEYSPAHQNGSVSGSILNNIINDLTFAFHYRRYGDAFQQTSKNIIKGIQSVTIALLLDMLYTQGDVIGRGIQLAIINGRIYNMVDTLPPNVKEAGNLSAGYDQIKPGLSIKGGVKYAPNLNNKTDYLLRYQAVKLTLKNKFTLKSR